MPAGKKHALARWQIALSRRDAGSLLVSEAGSVLASAEGPAFRAADNAIGPAQFRHERFAVFKVLEVENGFLKCAGCVHEFSMPEFAWLVK